jgi:hypothetical protein
METYIQNKGQYQTSVNGNIIDNTHWNMEYDGHELDLEAERNDEAIYMKLNNDDILKLLEVPAYHKTITQRLKDDLNSNNKMDVRPIIVEELEEDMITHTDKSNDSSKRGKSKKSKMSRKSTKKHSPNRSKRSSSSSSSSSSTKRRSRSRSRINSNKPKPEGPKPDYLQTIY